MRKEFSEGIEQVMLANSSTVFLTGDLGFRALENVQAAVGERFINAGVAEQNLISMAAGMAAEGLTPICYSIAPFMVFRPAEQVRLDVCLHNMNVKIVGNGGGYHYGALGASHHALEDIGVMSTFPNMKVYIPYCNEDVKGAIAAMMAQKGPSYLRLGFGAAPQGEVIPPWQAMRKIRQGDSFTIVATGPVVLNALVAIKARGKNCDIFIVSEIPLLELPEEFKESVRRTKKILILEEHVRRGGIGEMLALLMLKENLAPAFYHQFASGYPDGLYGSQKYHQKRSGLDTTTIEHILGNF